MYVHVCVCVCVCVHACVHVCVNVGAEAQDYTHPRAVGVSLDNSPMNSRSAYETETQATVLPYIQIFD